MTLTPEDRERIYQEEKARREARERISDERAASEPRGAGVAMGFILTVAIVAGLAIFGNAALRQATRVDETLRTPRPELIRLVNASPLVSELKRLEVVDSVDLSHDRVVVAVGPLFYQYPHDLQERDLEKLGRLIGAANGGERMLLVDRRTNETVGAWDRRTKLSLAD